MRHHGNAASGDEGLLGQLVWYSISDALRITLEALGEAIGHSGMDHDRLLPRAPPPRPRFA